MKIKKNKILTIIIVIIFILAYILFATKSTRNNIQLEPIWTMNVMNAEFEKTGDSVLPFKLGKNMGYFTENGKLCVFNTLKDNEMATITDDVYAIYDNNSTETEFHFFKQNESAVIKRAGFPFFENDRLFMMHPNGSGFSSYYKDGREKWDFEYYCPITSFQSTKNLVTIGFADGIIMILGPNGNKRHVIQPAGSEYEVIFGTAISNSENYVACISGLNKQRLVLIDIAESTSKIIYHEYVEAETIEQSLVQFSEDEKYVFFNEKDCLVAVNIEETTSTKIPIMGKVMQIKESHDGQFYFVLSKNSGRSTVHILNKNMYNVGSFDFDDENAFIETDDANLYVGNGQEISKIAIDMITD